MYTHRQVLLQMHTYFYLIRVNFCFFLQVMRVLKQFCCQLETSLLSTAIFVVQ